ncbi:MAG: hypothetical protein M3440_02905 [Chloroflexota bacterium]|nr:hypothetical protein [Chloroflexota bacterium]
MIVVRTVFQAKPGRGGELASRMAANSPRITEGMTEQMGVQRRWRVLTDLSGPFDTVVFEVEFENLAESERARPILFQLPAFQEHMAQAQELIAGGHNELWTIEAEG